MLRTTSNISDFHQFWMKKSRPPIVSRIRMVKTNKILCWNVISIVAEEHILGLFDPSPG